MRHKILAFGMLATLGLYGCAGGGLTFHKDGATPQENEMAQLECQRMAVQIGPRDGSAMRYANFLRCMRASGYSW